MNPILVGGWRVVLVWIFLLAGVPPALLWLAVEELRSSTARRPLRAAA